MAGRGAVCCMAVVENTFYYPLLQSNPISDLSELIWGLQIPRENAVSAKFRGPQNENETEIQKMAQQVLDISP